MSVQTTSCNYYFVGDGYEVLYVDAWRANAVDWRDENQKNYDVPLNLYTVDIDEVDQDGNYVFPHERALVNECY